MNIASISIGGIAMKKILLFILICLFGFGYADAETPKTFTLLTMNCEVVRSNSEREKRNDAFKNLCLAMGTDMIDYEQGRRAAINYVTDNRINAMNGLGLNDAIEIGKKVDADYIVLVNVLGNAYAPGGMFHTSIKYNATADLRIIDVKEGKEILDNSANTQGKREALLPLVVNLVETVKADIKSKSLTFPKK